MQIKSFKHGKKLIIFFTLIIFFSVVSLLAANIPFMISDKIYQGVNVDDIPVGGLSPQEASIKINEIFKYRAAQESKLIYKDQQWPITIEMIDLKINASQLATEAYNIGRSENIALRIKERYTIQNHGYKIPLQPTLNEEKLHSILKHIANQLDQDAQNAMLRLSGSTVVITSEVIGRKIDVAQAYTDLKNKLLSEFSFSYSLPVREIVPDVTAQDFEGIDGIIASYTTQFHAADQNRIKNIIIASRELNGTLVRSDEIFSFNAAIGPRHEKYGYKEAPVFLDGKLVPDWGGGVCQVSSTLYNAALLANAKIVERTSHFQPPGYVPLGQDATVADNQIDLKFINTTSGNLFIISEVHDNQITVQILGKRQENLPDIHIIATDKKIIEPNIIIKQDPELEAGKELVEDPGQKGFYVTTFRVKTLNGTEISREFLASDDFPSTDKIVRVGTKTLTTTK